MNLAEGLQHLSVLIGIWVAIYGIDAWRREHIGKRQLELAEDTLALFYEAADAVRHIRHPGSFMHETLELERGPTESDESFEARKQASVVFYRYNQYIDLFNELFASRYRFMAQVSKSEAAPFEELKSLVNEIVLSARRLANLWSRSPGQTEEQKQKHQEQVEKYEAIFWEGMEGDDPINPRLDKIISDMEETCKKFISGSHTLHGKINVRLWGRS